MATGFRTYQRHQPTAKADEPVTGYDLAKVQDNIQASVDPLVKSLSTSTIDEAQTELGDYAKSSDVTSTLTGYQLRSEKAAANGYADLDSSTQVPNTRIKWAAPSAIGGTTPSGGVREPKKRATAGAVAIR